MPETRSARWCRRHPACRGVRRLLSQNLHNVRPEALCRREVEAGRQSVAIIGNLQNETVPAVLAEIDIDGSPWATGKAVLQRIADELGRDERDRDRLVCRGVLPSRTLPDSRRRGHSRISRCHRTAPSGTRQNRSRHLADRRVCGGASRSARACGRRQTGPSSRPDR